LYIVENSLKDKKVDSTFRRRKMTRAKRALVGAIASRYRFSPKVQKVICRTKIDFRKKYKVKCNC